MFLQKYWRPALSIAILLLPAVAHAIVEQDLQDIMNNLTKLLTPAMLLLLSISFLLGLVFILKGLLLLKSFAQPLTQATKPGEIAGPMVYLFVGAVLIYIPTSTDILTNTLFGPGSTSIFSGGGGGNAVSSVDLSKMGNASDEILGYAPVSVEGQWATMVDTIVLYMEFIGFLAFLRGWLMIAHAGQPGSQPGSISKGIIHVVGGILAINFIPLVNAVRSTLGI